MPLGGFFLPWCVCVSSQTLGVLLWLISKGVSRDGPTDRLWIRGVIIELCKFFWTCETVRFFDFGNKARVSVVPVWTVVPVEGAHGHGEEVYGRSDGLLKVLLDMNASVRL